MVKVYYFETEDYNGLMATDGKRVIVFDSFPLDGTLEMAKSEDFSGIVGSKTLEEVINFTGVSMDIIDYDDFSYEKLEYICTL